MYHKYPPDANWYACNIKDIKAYVLALRKHLADKGKRFTAKRLKLAIEEDSFGEISLEECKAMLVS